MEKKKIIIVVPENTPAKLLEAFIGISAEVVNTNQEYNSASWKNVEAEVKEAVEEARECGIPVLGLGFVDGPPDVCLGLEKKVKADENPAGASFLKFLKKTSTKKPFGMPLGIIGSKLYCLPDTCAETEDYPESMKNVALVNSEPAKNHNVVDSMILTMIAGKKPFMIEDMDGEFYRAFAPVAKKMGMNVQVFSMEGMLESDSWNVLGEIVKVSQARVDDIVNDFVNIVLEDTEISTEKETFFKTGEASLLRALVYYVTRSPYCKEGRNIKTVMKILHGGIEAVDEIFVNGSVAKDEMDSAYVASATYRNSTNKARSSMVLGLCARLTAFENPDTVEHLSSGEIDVSIYSSNAPAAVFIVGKDKADGSADFIRKLFLASSYRKMSYESDLKLKPVSPFTYILCSGNAVDTITRVSKIISINRPRFINFVFAIQSYGQLEEKYGSLWENIIASCGITMIFGASGSASQVIGMPKIPGSLARKLTDEMLEKENILIYSPLDGECAVATPYVKELHPLYESAAKLISSDEDSRAVELADIEYTYKV